MPDLLRPCRPSLVAAVLVLAGCAGTPDAPAIARPLPIVTVTPGEAASVDLGRYLPLAVDPPPGIDVDVAADGAAAVRVGDGFRGLALVPFESAGERFVLAVQNPAGAGSLGLRRVGLRRGDPTVLELALTQRGPDGAPAPLTVDEDTGVVLLVDDREASETAVDFDLAEGVVGIDLDVAGAGAHRLRVAARADGLVSEWVELTVRDRRPAR